MKNKIYDIKNIFPIIDKKYLLIEVVSDSWESKGLCSAMIYSKSINIECKYLGFSNVNDKIVLKITIDGDFNKMFCKIKNENLNELKLKLKGKLV